MNPVLFLPLASSVVVLPIPPIPTLLGVTVGMETLTSTGLLPGQDPFPACGPPKFATKVRTSNTLLVTFQ